MSPLFWPDFQDVIQVKIDPHQFSTKSIVNFQKIKMYIYTYSFSQKKKKKFFEPLIFSTALRTAEQREESHIMMDGELEI